MLIVSVKRTKMIISYINADLDSPLYKQRIESLSHICNIFFAEIDNDFKVITERNSIVLRDLIIYYKPTTFMIDSLKGFPFSPTQIAELIIFMLNHNCKFQSKVESISFEKKHIIDVYPKVFELLKPTKVS